MYFLVNQEMTRAQRSELLLCYVSSLEDDDTMYLYERDR